MTALRTRSVSTVLIAMSVVISLVSLVVAVYAVVLARSAEHQAYQRVVDETWNSVQPVYKDFGIRMPASQPKSISEVLKPLMEINSTLPSPQ